MKKASESCVEEVYQIHPKHLNGAGRLFGGRLMEWIDEVAGFVGNGTRYPVNRAYLTLVAVEENAKTTKAIKLFIDTIGHQAE